MLLFCLLFNILNCVKLFELVPMLDLLSVSASDQFSLFMVVDVDSSGQIDFSEFTELMHLIGKKYSKTMHFANVLQPMVKYAQALEGGVVDIVCKKQLAELVIDDVEPFGISNIGQSVIEFGKLLTNSEGNNDDDIDQVIAYNSANDDVENQTRVYNKNSAAIVFETEILQ